ncbi:MAG: aldo/keto reductase [Sphingobacteriales bacterium]|nr:aldo/keto reductase [Sphingobacteriales bacterium]OJY90328.1 MAG: alcohol dehydrogenase [Sphingobacteriales bacterium 44-15]
MEKRRIKNTDLEIAPINLGSNVFGWTLDEGQSFNILDKFTGGGFNFIDTADTYAWWVNGSGGQSETIIGNWLKTRGHRSKMVIATKVGSQTKEHPYDISKKHILRSVDESLARLQTDYIDLYYTHFDDNRTAVEETLEAYDEIVKAGKVRYIAVSNVSPERIKASFDVAAEKGLPRYVALQPHYNVLVREEFETSYAPVVKEYDLSVFTYWSLEAGFLTGKYRTEEDFAKTARGGGIKKYFDNRGKAVLSALDRVAAKHNTPQATVALAWLLANPLVTAPIVSATSESQLQTIFDAPNIKLDEADIDLLNKAGKI